MFAEQGGVCAVCGQPERRRNSKGGIRRLSVDHDHATGEVRALLCHDCNTALGLLLDSPDLMRLAAAYVERHNEAQRP